MRADSRTVGEALIARASAHTYSKQQRRWAPHSRRRRQSVDSNCTRIITNWTARLSTGFRRDQSWAVDCRLMIDHQFVPSRPQ